MYPELQKKWKSFTRDWLWYHFNGQSSLSFFFHFYFFVFPFELRRKLTSSIAWSYGPSIYLEYKEIEFMETHDKMSSIFKKIN